MNKISLYILLILVYLGLSQTFSLTEKGTGFVKNKQVLSSYFEGSPLCVILINSFQTGFLFKTFYHKYKVIYGFKQPRILTVRTSVEFNEEGQQNIGLSIFRRDEGPNSESTIPMPPGTLFIGNPSYGSWTMIDSGEKVWTFHRAYRHFAKVLGWGDFRPSFDFYRTAKLYLMQERPFFGLHGEFGPNGALTRTYFPDFFSKSQKESITMGEFLKKLIKPKSIWNNR